MNLVSVKKIVVSPTHSLFRIVDYDTSYEIKVTVDKGIFIVVNRDTFVFTIGLKNRIKNETY